MPNDSLYETDFYAWATRQARCSDAGRLDAADIEHIAEEIDSMGRSEKRELVSRLTVVLLHLLKWQYQPALRGNSWRLSIANARDQLADHMQDNPSLKARLPEAMASAYRYARREAAAESGLPETTFPAECPWSFDQAVDEAFWP